MKASWLYRIACVLLLLFAIGHTLGFRQTNPAWGVGSLIDSMRSIHFDAQGFSRTYWDFFSAFGLFFSVFLLFAAVLAWQLGSLPAEIFAPMRRTAWALAISFAAVTALSFSLKGLLDFYLAHPHHAVKNALLLVYCPPLLDILPMYIIFLLATPVALYLASRWSWKVCQTRKARSSSVRSERPHFL